MSVGSTSFWFFSGVLHKAKISKNPLLGFIFSYRVTCEWFPGRWLTTFPCRVGALSAGDIECITHLRIACVTDIGVSM